MPEPTLRTWCKDQHWGSPACSPACMPLCIPSCSSTGSQKDRGFAGPPQPPWGWQGQLLVPGCSLLTQPPGQQRASRVRGFSFHFLSPSLLSGTLDMLVSALQEEIWDFIAFCSIGIAAWGPAAPWPPTHSKRLCFSVLSNLSACSAVTHFLCSLQARCMVKEREIAPSMALAFSNPALSCETAKELLEGPSWPCLMGGERLEMSPELVHRKCILDFLRCYLCLLLLLETNLTFFRAI